MFSLHVLDYIILTDELLTTLRALVVLLFTVLRDSCLLCCQSVESPHGALRPVKQPLSGFSHQMDWQPCCSNCTLAGSQHSTGLSLQLTITGDSRQLQEGGLGGLGTPLISLPSFHLIGGTHLNHLFAFLNAIFICQIWYLCFAGVGFTVSWDLLN